MRAGGVLEIFDAHSALCLQVDAALIVDLLAVHFRMARILGALQTATPDPLGREPLLVFPEPVAPPVETPVLAPPTKRQEETARSRAKRGVTVKCGAIAPETGRRCMLVIPCRYHPPEELTKAEEDLSTEPAEKSPPASAPPPRLAAALRDAETRTRLRAKRRARAKGAGG